LEARFLSLLERARSNLPEHRNGRRIFQKLVKPMMIQWEQIGAHYAVSSLFEAYETQSRLYCYRAERKDYRSFEAGKARLVVGQVRLTSEITRESEWLSFGALHFGDHNVNGGVRLYPGEEAHARLTNELAVAFAKADFPEIIRLMDRGFGESSYSLRSLFRDEQRRVTKRVLEAGLAEAEGVYRRLYQQHLPTMRFLADLNVPLPRVLETTAEFLLNTDLRWVLEDDEPNLETIHRLLEEAEVWRVKMDTAGLSYKLKKTIGRMAERFAQQYQDQSLLRTLEGVARLARALPFEVELWQPQNVYWRLLQTAYPEFLQRIQAGESGARDWAEHFLALGEELGMQVENFQKRLAEVKQAPTVTELLEAVCTRRIPRASYRLQFNRLFTLRDAERLVPYFQDLGISDLYASPLLKARPGSLHGYDVCDPTQLNPELGTDQDFEAWTTALGQRGMGLILDVVPNHMGIDHSSNVWWMDVLENGPSSVYASYFDIDWHPVNPDLENKVLLPVLGDQYGNVLESGQLRLAYEEGAFFLHYYDRKFPVGPRTYRRILEHPLELLAQTLGEANVHLQEYRSILTALSYLPQRTELPPAKIVERNREKEVVKRRIAALASGCREVAAALDATVQVFNGKVGEPRSFDLLDALIEVQAYRPAYWRVATEEINFRRFFDINELAAIRVERPEVFATAHQLIFRWLAEGRVTGLRIDHPDGLWNPTRYFRRLQEKYVLHRLLTSVDGGRWTVDGEEAPVSVPSTVHQPPSTVHRFRISDLEQLVQQRLSALQDSAPGIPSAWPLYVVAEKILGENEPLPQDWAVAGTTGYDFANAATRLFVNQAHRAAFDRIYARFRTDQRDFSELVKANQRMIMLVSMASEVNALSHLLDRISERNRRYRDFTLNSLTFAIREIIASLPIYRTYITGMVDGMVDGGRWTVDGKDAAALSSPSTVHPPPSTKPAPSTVHRPPPRWPCATACSSNRRSRTPRRATRARRRRCSTSSATPCSCAT
jgi:hypothetical protein